MESVSFQDSWNQFLFTILGIGFFSGSFFGISFFGIFTSFFSKSFLGFLEPVSLFRIFFRNIHEVFFQDLFEDSLNRYLFSILLRIRFRIFLRILWKFFESVFFHGESLMTYKDPNTWGITGSSFGAWRILADSCGFLWILVDSCGFLWILVDSCGFLRILVDSCGSVKVFSNFKLTKILVSSLGILERSVSISQCIFSVMMHSSKKSFRRCLPIPQPAPRPQRVLWRFSPRSHRDPIINISWKIFITLQDAVSTTLPVLPAGVTCLRHRHRHRRHRHRHRRHRHRHRRHRRRRHR